MRYEKIAPGLSFALEDYQREGAPGLARHRGPLGLVAPVDVPKPPRIIVFLHCDEAAGFSGLESEGIWVNQARGAVRTAFLPLERLERLSDDGAVRRIIPSRRLRPLLDVALPKVHVPAFRTASGLSGRGVIVGTVDSGIDPNHAAFAGRILRIWDQTLPGSGVLEGGFGAELQGSLLSVSRDTHGHGTHVAGIAAGAHPTFGGVAPAADLIVVRTDFQDAHIADGIRYIFRVAGEMGRPAVVNLSLGGHFDPHDGTDSLCLIANSESGPGRIVCCAAGNEGNDNIHGQTTVVAGGTRTMRFKVPSPQTADDDPPGAVGLNGWYAGGDQIEVQVQSPGGFHTALQGVITAGNPGRSYDLPDGRVRITTPGPDPGNGDHNFFVEIQAADSASPVTPGVWRLKLRGVTITNGRVDVWTLDNSERLDAIFTGQSVKDSLKIGSPGAAAQAVTVASYTTRNQWTDIDGQVRQIGMTLDDISDFSSEGPLRSGSQKPDVTAPGAMIVSALSADSPVTHPWMVNPEFRVMAGTSMATPLVVGLVALLLERNPTLDPAAVKALLKAHSKVPGKPSGTFDAKWGFGLIDSGSL